MGPGNIRLLLQKAKSAHQLTIPHLNEMACEQVEVASVPFTTFIADKKQNGEAASYSFVLRGYVRHWLDNVWALYDRAKVNEMLKAPSPM